MWEEWILFMPEGVERTSLESIVLITEIRELMKRYKKQIRSKYPKIYSQDLLNNLFRYPYTKIEFVQRDLAISRNTAIRYLNTLVEEGILAKHKLGGDNYYINRALFGLLSGNE